MTRESAEFINGKRLVSTFPTFPTIARCREAHANLIKNNHPFAKELAMLVDCRMNVLDFDQGREFGASTTI